MYKYQHKSHGVTFYTRPVCTALGLYGDLFHTAYRAYEKGHLPILV